MIQDLKELAKVNVREAMRKELEINRENIAPLIIKRTSPRQTKEYVFEMMARNDILKYFLNLDESEQKPESLLSSIPSSQEYVELMLKLRATRYPIRIKRETQRKLFYFYTHEDYKGSRYFLDEPLTQKPKGKRFGEVIDIILGWAWVCGFLALIIWGMLNDSDSNNQYSGGGSNTFNSGGISNGNSQSKLANDSPQVKDGSNAAGFGNGGVSGNDSSSSTSQTNSSQSKQTTNDINKKEPSPDSKSDDMAKKQSFISVTDKKLSGQQVQVTVQPKSNQNKNADTTTIKEDSDYFSLGSSKEHVKEIMGNPKSMIGDTWSYEYSSISFGNDGLVIGWSNISLNLKVFLGTKLDEDVPFTLGSSKQDVTNAMGTPSSIIGSTWGYGYSSVYFDGVSKVIGWSNIGNKLNVSYGAKKEDAVPFTVGSTKLNVLDAMGTPSSIIGTIWLYDYSNVFFDSKDAVINWSNISNNLNVK